jgi:glycosyltransferase involved in cell wall biosynthesis
VGNKKSKKKKTRQEQLRCYSEGVQRPKNLHAGVKLSLCMIVKNEEKNLAKALGSVKDIAFEKIVVDTGSTDKTVEIAKKNKAKVYPFKWINDFASARNFAIEKAIGDWILVLDADEFIYPEDAGILLSILNETLSEQKKWESCLAISCMLVNLDDNGRQMTKSSILRIFRNKPSIRFTGRIHEQIAVDINSITHTDDVTIYHTGYSETAHKETGKASRNIALLRAELASDPKNLGLKAYLANTLSMGTDEESQAEAESLFYDIINSGKSDSVNNVLRVKLYIFMINKYLYDPAKMAECEDISRKALDAFPGAIDFEYFMAVVLSKKGEHIKAWEMLKSCEQKLISGYDSGDSIMIPADPTVLFGKMILVAKDLGDIENVVLYSTHVLTIDKTRLSILSPCIATLLHHGITEPDVIGLLSNIYDFNNPNDTALVTQAATNCGASKLIELIRG